MMGFLIENMNAILESVAVFAAIFVVMCTMMRPRKYFWIAFLLLMAKSFYSKMYTGILLENASEEIAMLLPMINALILPFLVMLLDLLAFKDDPGKVIIASIFSETICIVIQQISIYLTGMLLHRGSGYADVSGFQWSDLLILPVFACIFTPLYFWSRPVLLRYRDWRMKYSWIALVLFGIQYVMAMPSYFVNYWSEEEVQTGYLAMFAVWAMFLLGVVYFYVMQTRRKTLLENERLRNQKNLFEANYALLRENNVAESAKMLNAQMEEFLQSKDTEASSERLKDYLDSLRESRTKAQAGIYCKDWLIDAMLVSQSQIMARKQLALECDMLGYDRGSIEEQELSQLLHAVLEQTQRDALPGSIILEMKTVANQLLITIEWKTGQKKFRDKRLPSWARKYLRKYEGEITCRQDKTACEKTICLQTDAELMKNRRAAS